MKTATQNSEAKPQSALSSHKMREARKVEAPSHNDVPQFQTSEVMEGPHNLYKDEVRVSLCILKDMTVSERRYEFDNEGKSSILHNGINYKITKFGITPCANIQTAKSVLK